MTLLRFIFILWVSIYCGFAYAGVANSEKTSVKVPSHIQTSSSNIKINLNTASVKELQTVPGLTAYKARAIVAYRKLHGEFKSSSDLNKVRGFLRMKPEKLAAIQAQLRV